MIITLKDKLIGIIKSSVKTVNCEFIGIELIRGRKILIRIYIDRQHGLVTIEDCVIVSKQVSLLLDKADCIPISYILEVSSPGLNRPLFSRAHFVKFIGSEIYLILYVMLYGRRKWRGVIKKVNDESIVLFVESNKSIDIMLNNVKKANLVPNFN